MTMVAKLYCAPEGLRVDVRRNSTPASNAEQVTAEHSEKLKLALIKLCLARDVNLKPMPLIGGERVSPGYLLDHSEKEGE
jgi:hypothetical protein